MSIWQLQFLCVKSMKPGVRSLDDESESPLGHQQIIMH